MDIEKLIERLRAHRVIYKTNYDEFSGGACTADCVDAADIISTLQSENDRLRKERDAIEQDFRVFTKQWWEEGNGFPCQWCKFERSDVCEQKLKHPNDEKPCAGRWFEWRGPKED